MTERVKRARSIGDMLQENCMITFRCYMTVLLVSFLFLINPLCVTWVSILSIRMSGMDGW